MGTRRCVLTMLKVPVVLFVLVFCGLLCTFVFAGSDSELLANADEFFPDQPGNEWRYRGQIVEGSVEQIAQKTFMNVSTVLQPETINGVRLTVFHDTNPGNEGPTNSYYRRDAAGILYYGSKPGTELERQLVPYQIIRFPLQIPSSFEQLNRKDISLGIDLDRDGQDERVDVQASVSMVRKESISVPFQKYHEAIRLEARMAMQVHLSRDDRTVRGTDVMTAWFARGVGLIKYVERQAIPMLGTGKQRVMEITEELEEAKVRPKVASSRRGKSSPQGIFADDPFHHELLQISFSSRFFAHPR